jgi:hypothetical protein
VQHGKDDVERRGKRVAGLREFGAADVLQRIRGAPLRGQRRYVERLAAALETAGCASGLLASRRLASPPVSQRPCLSMPIGTTSYFLRSMALRMEAAESSETSCSPERPPKRMPMRSFFFAMLT